MKLISKLLIVAAFLSLAASLPSAQTKPSDRITCDTIVNDEGIVLTSKDRLSTPGTFQPSVEIDIDVFDELFG